MCFLSFQVGHVFRRVAVRYHLDTAEIASLKGCVSALVQALTSPLVSLSLVKRCESSQIKVEWEGRMPSTCCVHLYSLAYFSSQGLCVPCDRMKVFRSISYQVSGRAGAWNSTRAFVDVAFFSEYVHTSGSRFFPHYPQSAGESMLWLPFPLFPHSLLLPPCLF